MAEHGKTPLWRDLPRLSRPEKLLQFWHPDANVLADDQENLHASMDIHTGIT